MTEDRAIHKFRESLRYNLKKEHPDWPPEKIKERISNELREFKKSSEKGQKGSKSRPDVQKSGSIGSGGIIGNEKNTGETESSERKFRSSKEGLAKFPHLWVRLDYSIGKSQIILKESLDGISWRTVGILTKNQAFERNGLVIAATWHKGSAKEGDTA